jgi:hypothetical protein
VRTFGIRCAVVGVCALAASALVPVVPIVAGALLVAAVGIHLGLAEMRPYLDPVLRVPVGRARKRHTWLALVAGFGCALVACGSVGAAFRGRLDGERLQRELRGELASGHVETVLKRARHFLAVGDLGAAELVLLEADAMVGLDDERRAEVDRLLDDLRRSGDQQAILTILTRMPEAEFDAFQRGAAVPAAFGFGEKMLTRRAVESARSQLDEARRLRAAR